MVAGQRQGTTKNVQRNIGKTGQNDGGGNASGKRLGGGLSKPETKTKCRVVNPLICMLYTLSNAMQCPRLYFTCVAGTRLHGPMQEQPSIHLITIGVVRVH